MAEAKGSAGIETVDNAAAISSHRFKYYDFVMTATVVIFVLSNLVGAAKLVELFNFQFLSINFGAFGAGILFFPLSYVLGDVLTEVYGYARARRVIWAGFAAVLFMALMCWVVVTLPPAEGWEGQEAYEAVFGIVPRIVAASVIAFWAGELSNAFVMARMKVWSGGKHLWQRTIGSTVVGQGVDSLLFYPIAFLGVWDTGLVITVLVTNYVLKVAWEALLTPVTYRVVHWLKRAEGVDIYDRETDFTPFSVKS